MKPSIPKGTRDFSPSEMGKRNFIFDAVRNVFQRYGYQQIETPAMENLSTLEGKYGEEGDRLLFRILNSGIDFSSLKPDLRVADISEKGLRYDLTVPFARYIVQHQHEITFPFKRYQLQPVWRADRPQKGRYREFYQCDADVIGSDSLFNEVELIQLIRDVFSQLNIHVSIRLNNRKILSGIAEVIGARDKIIDITIAIDKLDKIGLEKVNEELKSKGISPGAIVKLQPILGLAGNNAEKLSSLKKILAASETGMQGIGEMENIFSLLEGIGLPAPVCGLELDLTLARGLNYYTGAIIEVKVADSRSTFTSSICGGGRYDDLTGIFGLPGVSGVGISFGADRIYDVLEEMNGFPEITGAATKIMFANFGKDEAAHCLKLLQQLRDDGINGELYPDTAKMKKQMGYADDKKISFVALIGSEEMKTGEITVKNMVSGEQSKVTLDELLHMLK